MGDDVPMAEGGGGETHEILPVYQPNTKSAFIAYKVRWFMRGIQEQETAHESSANWRVPIVFPVLAIVDAARNGGHSTYWKYDKMIIVHWLSVFVGRICDLG